MAMNPKTPKTFNEYLDQFSKEVRPLLKKMRLTVKKAAPQAKESISYRLPTFTTGRNRVYFGAFKSHIGFFPGAAPIKAFAKELSKYKWAKGSVQFPFDRPLPLGLVGRMVKFRMKK